MIGHCHRHPFLGYGDMGEWTRIYHEIGMRVAIRRFGAASLDLAWVAAGRYDGFWESNLKPWDTAAGCLWCARPVASCPTIAVARSRSAMKPCWLPTTRCIPLHKLVATAIKG
jgi:myo-inositol-1(or 4)-monophosphatase